MRFETWEAIAAKHLRYRELLMTRMAEWSESRVAACTDPQELRDVMRLTERVEQHEARMGRHLQRGLGEIPASGKVN